MKRIFVFLILIVFGYCGYSQFMYRDNGEKCFFAEDTLVKYIHFITYNENVQQTIHSLKEIGYCDWDEDCLILRCELYPNQTNHFNEICANSRDEICFVSSEFSNKKQTTLCGITNKIFVQTDNINSVCSYLTENQIKLEKIEPISIERNEYVLIFKPQCANTLHIANQIYENVDVKYSQPEFLHRNLLQNPLYPYQWGENNTGQYCDTSGFDIRIEDAWNITKGDSNIIVAVFDLGVDTNHEDLRPNLVQGKNVLTGANNGQEGHFDYHGTACAGIIAAADNDIGGVGVAPLCHILPIRMSSYRYASDLHIINAFKYIADSSEAAIASCSWLPNWDSPTIDNALLHFVRNGRNGKGGLVVFSVGNQNESGNLLSDSCKLYCITVGAIGPDGTRKEYTSCDGDYSWGSNYGECLCVMAPGTKVPTTMSVTNASNYTYAGDNYILDFDGTSAACPHVAGVAALVLSANPNLSGRKVKEIIERTCTKVRNYLYDYDSIAPHGTWDYQMGYGLVNAYQAVLMAQGCKDYPYCTIDTIRGNITWNAPITVGETLVIDSLAILTVTDTVAFYSEARIIVRPGGKLIVNGGTLTNACDGEMWEGIIVEGDSTQRQQPNKQGAVYLTNATIENAFNAVSTRGAENNDAQWAKTGGIVQATNTLFRNNLRSADFLPYENHKATGGVASNASYFTRCTFIVDDTHLFAESNEYFLHHVTLYGVRGVKFEGCTFRNETIEHVGLTRGSAITAEEAGFVAQRVCPMVSNLDPCGCLPSGSNPVTRCSFEGFFEAVHAASTLGNYDITIDNCDFAHNRTGVTLSVADNARVSFCDFDLSDTLSYCGIELDNSTGYTVEENFFHKQTYTSSPEVRGVTVNSSGTAENVIRKNEFTRLNNGIIATGTNALISRTRIPGLQFKCNDFTGCNYDIHIPTGVTRGTQGSQSEGADNNFQETAASSFNSVSSSNTTLYYYSATPLHIPRHPSSFVYINNTAAANSCSSTLCVTQVNPKSGHPSALAQYRALAEEYADLAETWCTAFLQPTDTMMPDNPQDAETATLQSRLSDLSAAMGDLARTEIRAILSDTVVDMALLKEWYGTIVETMYTSSLQTEQSTDLPVAAYQLSEVYSTKGDYAAANALLASLPQSFHPDEAARNEYANYLNLQRLRENVSGNWYRQTDTEISDLQRVAEYDNGRAARMAKEILCFFHHICYEDEPLLEWNGGAAGERGHRGGVSGNVSTPTADGLRLHPNPAHNTLTVESDSPVREITIYDLTGKTMMTIEHCPLPTAINVVSLPRGIYLLWTLTDSGVKTARFVKN